MGILAVTLQRQTFQVLAACAPALQRDAAQTQRARALIASMHERLHTFAEAGDGRPAPAV